MVKFEYFGRYFQTDLFELLKSKLELGGNLKTCQVAVVLEEQFEDFALLTTPN
jgi:hypothetical protein